MTKEEFILVGLAEKCLVLSSKLQDDLRSDGGFRKALKARWKKSWNKKCLEELSTLEQAMRTQILSNSCIRVQAMQAEQQDNFVYLDAQLKDFIKQIHKGQTKLEEIIRSETTRSRDHTTAEADLVRNHFTAQFSITTATLKQEADKQEHGTRREKLLASLAFPEMNARKNTSSIDAYQDTFQWVFDEDEKRAWNSFPSFLASRERKVYWISGKPGSGKSTLMKFLIGHRET